MELIIRFTEQQNFQSYFTAAFSSFIILVGKKIEATHQKKIFDADADMIPIYDQTIFKNRINIIFSPVTRFI